MKHLTIESFINSLLEEDLWKIILEDDMSPATTLKMILKYHK